MTPAESSPTPGAPATRPAAWLLAALVVLYALQLASPLRLNNDAEALLSLARSASTGHGFTVAGAPTHFPPGYPFVVALLDRAGLANSATLIALNLLVLAAGLRAWARTQARAFAPAALPPIVSVLATLLAWPVIKHITLPISDTLYTGLSLLALSSLHAGADRGPHRLRRLSAALLLAAAAISVRTVGLALLPAILVALIPSGTWPAIGRWGRAHRIPATLLGLAMVALAGGAGCLIARTLYVSEMLAQMRATHPATLAAEKLLDWGELALNVPASRLPGALHPLILLAGVLVPIVLARGMVRRRRLAPVDAYVIAYVGIMLVWPYHDARFWLPLLPLLPAYAWIVLRPLWPRPIARALLQAYLLAFTLAGAAALTQSTRLSFAGATFPDRYAGGALRTTYRAAFGQPPAPGDTTPVNPRQLALLEHYERRARIPAKAPSPR